jgi:hypothetical protein
MYIIILLRALCWANLIHLHSVFVISVLLPVHLHLCLQSDNFLEFSYTCFCRYTCFISTCLCYLPARLIHLKLIFQSVELDNGRGRRQKDLVSILYSGRWGLGWGKRL